MRTKKWTMKDGNKIRVMDMQTDHLERTIDMIERNCRVFIEQQLSFFCGAPLPNGDMAQLAWEDEFDFWLDANVDDVAPEIYYEMLDELARRKSESKDGERTRANAQAASAFASFRR